MNEDELANLPNGEPSRSITRALEASAPGPTPISPAGYGTPLRKLTQWTTDESRFMPAARTVPKLRPGLYEIQHDNQVGIFFRAVPVKTEGLLRLPHTNSERVLTEIQTFWASRDGFKSYGLSHKRGILLWGPPGSGKSCTIQLVMADVIARGGVGIVFCYPPLFIEGMRMLREIQPETPAVVLMEDLDSIVRDHPESAVLNLLDGAEAVDGMVFLASTNYPELLGARIVNRPSRFDRRIKIGHPTAVSRKMYLDSLFRGREEDLRHLNSLDTWAHDTEGMSLAHLRELFVSVVLLACDYEDTIERLRAMRESISSSGERTMGLLSGS